MSRRPIERLDELRRGAAPEETLAFFDGLPAASVDEILGEWVGSGCPTGHPLDGLLEASGWRGKRFDSPEDAHPLLFRRSRPHRRSALKRRCRVVGRHILRFAGGQQHRPTALDPGHAHMRELRGMHLRAPKCL